VCITYVTHAHSYNEGGEGSILKGPLRDNQLLHRLVINAETEQKGRGTERKPDLLDVDDSGQANHRLDRKTHFVDTVCVCEESAFM